MKKITKRIVSLFLASAMLLSMSSTAVFADEGDDGSSTPGSGTGDETEFSAQDVLDDYYDLVEEGGECDNIMLQTLVSELEFSDASPMWIGNGDTSDHGILANATLDEFGNEYTAEQKETIATCLVFGAYIADAEELHNRGPNNSIYKVQLHAIDNYIINLIVVWKYAKLVRYSDVDSRILNSNTLANISEFDRSNVEILLDTIPEVYDLFEEKYGRKPTTFEKKYLVMGLGLHLIGDIYAHRALVPASYGVIGPDTTTIFDPGHFGVNYANLLAKARTGTLLPTKIKTYMVDSISKKNRYYEDNPDFMPERWECSMTTSENFIRNIQITSNNFSSDYIVHDSVNLYKWDIYVASLP